MHELLDILGNCWDLWNKFKYFSDFVKLKFWFVIGSSTYNLSDDFFLWFSIKPKINIKIIDINIKIILNYIIYIKFI